MIITCEECNTSYNLDANQLQSSGTKVRCTSCQHVFTAYPPPDEAPATIKAEPVTEAQTDTLPHQTADDDLEMLDSDDLFDMDADDPLPAAEEMDSENFDFSDEDFELPGNDMDLPEVEELSDDDLELTDDDLDLVMDMAPGAAPSVPIETEAPAEAEAPADPTADDGDTALAPPDLVDIDALLDTADTSAPAAETTPETEGDSLADLDQDFDDVPEEADAQPPVLEGTDELDLDLDLDLDLGDDDTDTDEGGISEEMSLSLDEGPAAPAEDAAAEALGSEDDVDFEVIPEPVGEEKSDGDGDGLDFEDLDLDLDFAAEGDTEDTNASDDAELALEMDDAPAEAAGDDLDLDLDFDLEADEDTPEPVLTTDDATAEDALDSLELDLAGEDVSFADETEDGDLSLDLDSFELVDDAAEDADKLEEALELDLGGDLELAMEDDKGASQQAEEDDLDLADLEGLLEDGGSDAGNAAAPKVESAVEESALFGDDDLGLGSELESILDDDGDASDDTFSLEEEPELDLDLESPVSATGGDDDLDLSDFEYLAEDGETAPSDDHFDSGDMELEFQVDEEGASALEEADAGLTPPNAPEDLPAEPEIVPETPAAVGPAGPAPVPPKKRGTSKLLIAVLIIVLLLGGGYCAYVLLDGMGIRIPYLSDYLKPEANDPGNLQMTTFDINSRFVDSQVLGRIFVITGKVKNGYDHPRGFVQLTGKLFTKGKVLANSQAVYAGNLISDMDLVNLSAEELKKRLNNRFGNNRMNSRVQPGKALPFMVVFSKLPEAQLEEFTIEVDASTALK